MKNLPEILLEIDQRELSAIAEVETHHDLDQAQLKNAIKEQVKNLYANYDLKSGQSVLVKNANSIKFFVDFLALYFLEITAVPLDPHITANEYQVLLHSLSPQLVITDKEIIRQKGIVRDEFIGVALILFTSGTTNRPKGVMITRKALDLKMELMGRVLGAVDTERTLCFVPTFFGHGLICNSLFPIFFGKKLYVAGGMSIKFAEKLPDFLMKERITFFSSVPSHWEFILNFSGNLKSHSLRRVHCASAPLRQDKIRRILQWLGPGVNFFDIYGATEMLGWFAERRITAEESESTFKNFWEAEKKISEQGEMILKSAYMAKGYWVEGRIESLTEFNTGDVFSGSALKGRTKNVINKNGIKIQVEDIVFDVLKSGLTIDAAAFPIPDDYTGERIGLFVILKAGADIEELWKYCRDSISPLKIPSEIMPVAQIPVNKRGKASLNELQRTFFDLNLLDQEALKLFNRIFRTDHKSIDIHRSAVPHWDSMRHAELVINLQKQFAVKFSVNDLLKVENFKDLTALIKKSKLGQ